MKMAYIYQETGDLSKANVYQSKSMVKAYSHYCEVDYYRGWKKMDIAQGKCGINQVKIINLGLFQHGKLWIEKISRLLFCIHVLFSMHLRKCQLIYTRDFGFLLFYSYLPKRLRLKVPIFYEAHKVYHRVSEKVKKFQEAKAISTAHLIISVSKGIKEDLVTDFGMNPDDILLEANGIEIIDDLNLNNKNESINRFVYAGSLDHWKGVGTLLEAAGILENFNGKIFIIGGNEEEQAKLKSIGPDWIQFVPRVDRTELFPLLTTMDVGIIPTLDEIEGTRYTSPIKFFEYIQCGLSILASDTYAMKSIEALGFKMEFFKVGDAHSLASNIQKIAGQPQNSNLKRHNSDLIKSFSWQKRAERIIENYRIIDTST